jgi:putative acetyltransferase
MAEVVIVGAEGPSQAGIADLLAQSDAIAARLYPGGRRCPTTPEALAELGTCLLVARWGGVAVGLCIVLERGDGTAELRRMIVDERVRRQGVGAALLRAAEAEARRLGAGALLLEVGTRNTEAQTLYGRAGYKARKPFPPHRALPTSLFLERRL